MDSKYLLMEWQNGFEATLDARVVLSDTYIPMTPVPTGNFGRLVLEDTSKENFEIIRYTSKDAHGVFIEALPGGLRNEDGTSTGIHPRGARVRGNVTAQDLREWRASAKAVQDSYAAFVAGSDWRAIPVIPTVSASNGNKEHVLTFAGTDLTSTLPVGSKLKIPRSVAPMTQSIKAVASSSQYASRAAGSVTNFGFTTTFTLEAIVNIDAYTTTDQAIVGRYNGSTGFILHLDPNGRVVITGIGRNGRTLRAVPTGVDTHIAGSINMITGETKVYIDGIDSPLVTTGSSTAITQAGDLQIGRYNTTGYLNGSVTNVRIWSTIRTLAQIRDNAHVKLVGNEAGLVFATKDDGTFNDLTANANNLSPTNGITATQAKHPFSAVEYGIVTKVTKPGADTLVTVFSGRNFIPTQTLLAVSYATVDNPIGFPRAKGRWSSEIWFMNTLPGKSGVTVNVWYGAADHATPINTGDWRLFWDCPVYSTNTGGVLSHAMFSLSTATNAETNKRLTQNLSAQSNVSSQGLTLPAHAEDSTVSQTAQTLWYPVVSSPASTDGGKVILFDNTYSVMRIVAECAYI